MTKSGELSEFRVPDGLDSELVPIAEEALRIHESANWSSQGQFEQAKVWRRLNGWLGIPAAVAATLAGGALLSRQGGTIFGVDVVIISGILALIAAALSATLTTINAARRMTQAQSTANGYLQLQTLARQLVLIDIMKLPYDDARQKLEVLTAMRDELNKTADPIGWLSYRRARRNLEAGGQAYEVDKESK